ncbi:MAG: hypothetical protein MOB07_25825 [Acidobacteria bacterium]|nr:hypothetical protein [Acidobacteriota bacterium]
MKYLSRVSNLIEALCLSLFLMAAASVPSFAQVSPLATWTSVASTGAVDDASAGMIGFSGPQAYLNAGVTSAVIRYNVTATGGLFIGPGKRLTARFYKPDTDTRLVMTLFEHSITGPTIALATLDSNAFAPSAAFQVHSGVFGGSGFDFWRNSYYVEVKLIRNAAGGGGGDPRLSMLHLTTF